MGGVGSNHHTGGDDFGEDFVSDRKFKLIIFVWTTEM